MVGSLDLPPVGLGLTLKTQLSTHQETTQGTQTSHFDVDPAMPAALARPNSDKVGTTDDGAAEAAVDGTGHRGSP
jgi:hypothetical protein